MLVAFCSFRSCFWSLDPWALPLSTGSIAWSPGGSRVVVMVVLVLFVLFVLLGALFLASVLFRARFRPGGGGSAY